jgi:hypothetical protein
VRPIVSSSAGADRTEVVPLDGLYLGWAISRIDTRVTRPGPEGL